MSVARPRLEHLPLALCAFLLVVVFLPLLRLGWKNRLVSAVLGLGRGRPARTATFTSRPGRRFANLPFRNKEQRRVCSGDNVQYCPHPRGCRYLLATKHARRDDKDKIEDKLGNHPMGNGTDVPKQNSEGREGNEPNTRKHYRFGDHLQVLDHRDLIDYYQDVQRHLGSGERESNEPPRFSLQYLQPRHLKSMVRCILNHHPRDREGGQHPELVVSKSDLQHWLRSIEVRRRWKLTRILLFGEEHTLFDSHPTASYNFASEPETTSGSEQQPLVTNQWWWQTEGIAEQAAPGFTETILGMYRYGHANATIHPKKFLSRLASGRAFKGDFRALLEEHCRLSRTAATAPMTSTDGFTTDGPDQDVHPEKSRPVSGRQDLNSKLNMIALYDEIVGDQSKGEDREHHDLELIGWFVDELEESFQNRLHRHCDASSVEQFVGDEHESGTSQKIPAFASLPTVGREQLDLLRAVCDLPVGNAASSSSSSPANWATSQTSDGGLSVGKKGERDLSAFLEETRALPCPRQRVLAPVWVRHRAKNRRNTKGKCRCVLELPERRNEAQDTGGLKILPSHAVSMGTTTEYDAMVVRIVGEEENDSGIELTTDCNGQRTMVIDEVWEAKATLDPSALLDALEKKVRSLRAILLSSDSGVLNLDAEGGSGTNIPAYDNATASFVILPQSRHHGLVAPAAAGLSSKSLAMVYRAGIQPSFRSSVLETFDKECSHSNNYGNDEDLRKTNECDKLPQIGAFASRMIGPRAGARRIQTIVYERLLETDLETVRAVIAGNSTTDNGNEPSTHGLVREDSLELVERILRLVRAVRPVVVVGTLPSEEARDVPAPSKTAP
ncbi:unnamed protein product [Pseudo-nitzschia multistriata]|uniref:Uncharacterized protein n=1 Tax=Pseudo-nitzschia multistriata TaxID=183589 RepID=A0A448Z975_9STRA|nr:unnamed protein product [Pseudo-nitzschia multistriata]